MKKIIKVDSLNLSSKKESIQNVISNIYSEMLNGIQIPIQIICKGEKFNLKDYSINNDELNDFLKQKFESNNIINKIFYIVFEGNKYQLDSTEFVIKKSLKSMNINYYDLNEDNKKDYCIIKNFNTNYVKDENGLYKTFFIKDWPTYCTLGWLDFLYNLPMNIDINCFIKPQNNLTMIKLLKKKFIQYNVNTEFEFDSTLDDKVFDSQLQSVDYMLNEIRSNEGKMFYVSYYITVKGKDKEELLYNSLSLKTLLESKNIKIVDCWLYQNNAYKNTLLNGKDNINKNYNFTTSTLKCFFPFLTSTICDKNGIFVGTNEDNNSPIFLDIFSRQYAVMLIMGIMGSGKSYLSKNLIKNLSESGIEVTVFDKSGEYENLNNNDTIKVHSNKTLSEYIQILKKYNALVNSDYNKYKNNIKPRLLLIDELWYYINSNEYADDFNSIFNQMILEGRKKYLAICFITQIIESLISNQSGQTILKTANIKFLMKMNHNESKLISDEFDLNEQQQNYLVTAEHEGIMLVNSNCVKFKVNATKSMDKLFNTNPHREVL